MRHASLVLTGAIVLVSLLAPHAGAQFVFPKHAAAQAAVNPGAPSSTVQVQCDFFCPFTWTMVGGQATLVVTNDHDDHVYRCVWPAGGQPACEGHGHTGTILTSTLTADEPGTVTAVVWRAN